MEEGTGHAGTDSSDDHFEREIQLALEQSKAPQSTRTEAVRMVEVYQGWEAAEAAADRTAAGLGRGRARKQRMASITTVDSLPATAAASTLPITTVASTLPATAAASGYVNLTFS